MGGTVRVGWIVVLSAGLIAAGCIGPWASEDAFVDIGSQAGLTYVVDDVLPSHARPFQRLGGGVAVGDVDGDGWPDVYVADAGPNVLYLNQGDGTFTDATEAWGARDDGVGRAPALFDHDNDGDLDLFVGNDGTPSRLLENTGERFRDVTETVGLELTDQVANVAVADVDGNGHLDLFVGNYGDPTWKGPERYAAAENGRANKLYLNEGDGTFRDASEAVGFNRTRWTLASAFSDYDRDGDADLYVANDFGWDQLFVNEDGVFRDEAFERGIEINTNGMGATWFDADGDADLDLYVTAIHVPGSPVPTFDGNDLMLQHEGRFVDATRRANVADAAWAWDAEALDLEHDGDVDLYVANGFHSREGWDAFYDGGMKIARQAPGHAVVQGAYNATHDYYFEPGPSPTDNPRKSPLDPATVSQAGHQRDRLFVNDGDTRFSEQAGALGADLLADSRGVASIDFDRDGDLDLVVTSAEQPIHLLENRVAKGDAHWLQLVPEPGEGRPAVPVGTIVEVQTGQGTQVREIRGPAGFMSQSEGVAHFGLGEASTVDRVTVHWPWGETTVLEDVDADQRLVVEPRTR